jgi:16S rRNA (uracil1498-N3)-methyltransferase
LSTPPLFFVAHLPAGPTVRLDGAEGRHAARVRRLAPGEPVRVADGLGGLADCVVESVERDALVLAVTRRRSVPEPDPALVVVQAPPKGERGELAVELLTELGADEIVPWAAERAIVQWHGDRAHKAVERWRRTAREAAKQSRRPRVPVIHDVETTAQVTERIAGAACALVLHEAADASLSALPLPSSGPIVLVVGPEGGITDREMTAFTSAGGRGVRLGDTVLRSSTAGAAGLAVVSDRLGRWECP